MKIGIIGSGNIGANAARLFVRAGHEVALSNSRGGEGLEELVAELAPRARATTIEDAAHFGEVSLVAIPFGKFRELPAEAFAGKIVLDAGNYYPQRDGHFAELDNGHPLRANCSPRTSAVRDSSKASTPSGSSTWRHRATRICPSGSDARSSSPATTRKRK